MKKHEKNSGCKKENKNTQINIRLTTKVEKTSNKDQAKNQELEL
ncbi:MAG: hypothetical protein QNJ55_31745 [Xenococcus sp. MO_188.B8]|nr:hypothetical protein [Xenococcus sp. MO_188.B8]